METTTEKLADRKLTDIHGQEVPHGAYVEMKEKNYEPAVRAFFKGHGYRHGKSCWFFRDGRGHQAGKWLLVDDALLESVKLLTAEYVKVDELGAAPVAETLLDAEGRVIDTKGRVIQGGDHIEVQEVSGAKWRITYQLYAPGPDHLLCGLRQGNQVTFKIRDIATIETISTIEGASDKEAVERLSTDEMMGRASKAPLSRNGQRYPGELLDMMRALDGARNEGLEGGLFDFAGHAIESGDIIILRAAQAAVKAGVPNPTSDQDKDDEIPF